MQNKWQISAKNSLKGASNCNKFFKSKEFVDNNFPAKIPLEFANLIDKNNPKDPLLQQVISKKCTIDKEFVLSPLADEDNSPVAGLVYKYENRALLIASRVCAIHCQYCFRQNFNYSEHDAVSNWENIREFLTSNKQINEIILSGGDPLSLSDEKLCLLIENIAKISSVKTLRVHSRTFCVVPSRITKKLIDCLLNSDLRIVVVTHINHAQEISAAFIGKVKTIKGITLLNQTVLLRGVNDSAKTLSDLSYALFAIGILPYYLHMLDKVGGAQDFFVTDEKAKNIHSQLQKKLSGYLVPKLVRDEDTSSKVWLV